MTKTQIFKFNILVAMETNVILLHVRNSIASLQYKHSDHQGISHRKSASWVKLINHITGKGYPFLVLI